jgi:beta-glucanase (GH16 family)
MDSTSQYAVKQDGYSQSGRPPYAPHQPLGQPYWQADFNPSNPVSETFTHKLGVGVPPGWGNNELQHYTASAANSFYTDDRKLVIRAVANSNLATPCYTSARLVSIQTLCRKSGFVSAVITAPCAVGVWPAFWMLPEEPFTWPTDGEVDIFETWNGDRINHSSLHWGKFDAADKDKHHTIEKNMHDMARTEGHMYGFAWEQEKDEDGSPGRMVWYVDWQPVMKADIPKGTRKMSDYTILLNVAMGGDVVKGVAPADGEYELIVHSLQLYETPPGGWMQFHDDYSSNTTSSGHAMP